MNNKNKTQKDYNYINYNYIKCMIKDKIINQTSPQLYEHILNITDIGFGLLKALNMEDLKDNLEIAILLHDIAKDFNTEELKYYIEKYNIELDEITRQEEALWHGPIGSNIAKYVYKIEDEEILEAIYIHSTGKANMSTLAKLLIVSDYLDSSKNYANYDNLRLLAEQDLDSSLVEILTAKMEYVLKKGKLLHPNSLQARNYYLSLIKNKRCLM